MPVNLIMFQQLELGGNGDHSTSLRISVSLSVSKIKLADRLS